jgi:hypothetical protein
VNKYKELSPELQARVDKTRAEAHQRVVANGKIQFRLDPETMELLLRLADDRRTGAGVLARMWVCERLQHELLGGTSQTMLPASEVRKIVQHEVREALREYSPNPKKRR